MRLFLCFTALAALFVRANGQEACESELNTTIPCLAELGEQDASACVNCLDAIDATETDNCVDAGVLICTAFNECNCGSCYEELGDYYNCLTEVAFDKDCGILCTGSDAAKKKKSFLAMSIVVFAATATAWI